MEVTSGKGNQVPLWRWMLSKLRYAFLEPYQMVEIVGIPIFEGFRAELIGYGLTGPVRCCPNWATGKLNLDKSDIYSNRTTGGRETGKLETSTAFVDGVYKNPQHYTY